MEVQVEEQIQHLTARIDADLAQMQRVQHTRLDGSLSSRIQADNKHWMQLESFRDITHHLAKLAALMSDSPNGSARLFAIERIVLRKVARCDFILGHNLYAELLAAERKAYTPWQRTSLLAALFLGRRGG